MGCCGSSEAEAEETSLPPPEWGKPISVRLKKKFMSADYNVLVPGEEGKEVPWMLLDAVGSMWDAGYVYYLKHRPEGQEESSVLGSVNIQGDWDGFSFKVSGGDRDQDFGPFVDLWDGDIDWGFSDSSTLWAVWTYSRRAVLYSDYEMTQQIGWLDVTGSGTWYEFEEERVVYDEDENGEQVARYERYHEQDCKTHGFQYSFNVFNTPMIINYRKHGGGFFKSAKLFFTAANAFDPGVPLFTVEGDGEYNATVKTMNNSDPVSTLLAAYAISCKLDPKDFSKAAERFCSQNIHLGMHPGYADFIGMQQEDFEERFSYPAPPPQVFAGQMQGQVHQRRPSFRFAAPPQQQMFVPPPQPVQPQMVQPQMMAQPMPGQPMMAQPMPGQPMMAQPMPGQPMMAQPMPGQPMMAQPMPGQPMMAQAMPAAPQPMMMTATATVPGGQPMQLQTPTGVITVQVPMGVQPGQQFQFQTAAPPPQMAQPAMAQPAYGTNYPPQ